MNELDWETLIQRHLDGLAEVGDVAVLSERLEADTGFRLVYLRLARVHAALGTELAEESRVPPPSISTVSSATVGKPRRSRNRRLWLAAAAVAATVTFGLIANALLREPVAPPPQARFAEVHGSVRWTGDGGQAESDSLTGRAVSGGTIESLSVDSWAVLEYRDGTTLTLTGRSRMTVVSAPRKEVRLDQGRLSASVSRQPDGRPMVIHTPTAKLEILGTQLNVEAAPDGTLVNVNEGRVRVTRVVDGRVAEVPADHQTVAAVDRLSEFRVTRRPDPSGVWRSVFPRDAKYGEWQVGPDGSGSLRAMPLLLTCAQPKPLLLYATVANVTAADASPPVLGTEGRFLVRGRIVSTAEVVFGMTMNYPKGGFAGKYIFARTVEVHDDAKKLFEWTLPLSGFKPLEKAFPPATVGLELVDCWCVTVHEDHGLSVSDIELQSNR